MIDVHALSDSALARLHAEVESDLLAGIELEHAGVPLPDLFLAVCREQSQRAYRRLAQRLPLSILQQLAAVYRDAYHESHDEQWRERLRDRLRIILPAIKVRRAQLQLAIGDARGLTA